MTDRPTAGAVGLAPERAPREETPDGAGDTADALLAAYRPGATFLAGPSGTLLAEGTRVTETTPGADGGLPARVAALLAGHGAGSVMVGAVPFEDSEAPMLRIPETVRWAPPLDVTAEPTTRVTGTGGTPGTATPCRVRALPRPDRYRSMVREALAAIDTGAVEKVVLARSLALEFDDALDPEAVLRALAARDRRGHLFAVDLDPVTSGTPAGRTLVGASPELLVSRHGTRVEANPLAGSAPRGADPEEDARVARELLVSPKDRHEHAVVVDAVARALRPFCAGLDVPAEPEVLATPTIWHLSTRLTGTLADPADPASSALALGLALHPTPAVCGAPRKAAHDLLAAVEPCARGFYAGLLGWVDDRGDGEWVVALRCGELAGRRARVHAGAGIVAGSSPDAELVETRVKFGRFLDALGVDGTNR